MTVHWCMQAGWTARRLSLREAWTARGCRRSLAWTAMCCMDQSRRWPPMCAACSTARAAGGRRVLLGWTPETFCNFSKEQVPQLPCCALTPEWAGQGVQHDSRHRHAPPRRSYSGPLYVHWAAVFVKYTASLVHMLFARIAAVHHTQFSKHRHNVQHHSSSDMADC
jgi:hypothetical protein